MLHPRAHSHALKRALLVILARAHAIVSHADERVRMKFRDFIAVSREKFVEPAIAKVSAVVEKKECW